MSVADYHLKIDGIEGESQDSKHANEIEVLSFSWGANQTGTFSSGSGGGAGKVQMHDFTFNKRIDKSSPKLVLACANGEHIGKAVLTCRKAGTEQQEFLKITFSDVLVSSYRTGGAGSNDPIPLDEISLNYSKIEFDYKTQDAKGNLGGSVMAGWDVKKNQKI